MTLSHAEHVLSILLHAMKGQSAKRPREASNYTFTNSFFINTGEGGVYVMALTNSSFGMPAEAAAVHRLLVLKIAYQFSFDLLTNTLFLGCIYPAKDVAHRKLYRLHHVENTGVIQHDGRNVRKHQRGDE